MLDQLWRRLSYANVMATIAVFGVLAGGGAYAASKIGPKGIKKNAVRAKHIKNGAVSRAKLGNKAKPRWAVVDGGGTVVRGAGARDATRTSDGQFRVSFDRNVTQCAYLATPGGTTPGVNAAAWKATVGRDATDSQAVWVITSRATTGDFDSVGFHLSVLC